jgi:hypothetical protein
MQSSYFSISSVWTLGSESLSCARNSVNALADGAFADDVNVRATL